MKRYVTLFFAALILLSCIGCSTRLVTIDEDPFGIKLSVKDVTPTSLTLILAQEGDQIEENTLTYGSAYTLEVYKDGAWEAYPYLSEDAAPIWTLIAYFLPQNGSTQELLSWETFYGTLSAGKYRICKELTYAPHDGKKDTRMYYAEFEIK